MKAYEKLYPQLVKIVNELKAKIVTSQDEPLVVTPISSLIAGSGDTSSLRTNPTNSSNWVSVRPQSGRFNVQVSSLILQDGQTQVTVVVPINQIYHNLTVDQVSALETTFHVWNNLYPVTTSAKVIYSTLSFTGVVQQYVYVIQSGT